MNIRKNKIDRTGIICVYLAPLAGTFLHCFLAKTGVQSVYSQCILTVLLSGIFMLFVHTTEFDFYQKIRNRKLFWTCFVLSSLFLGTYSLSYTGVLWFLMTAFAALDAGKVIAYTLHIFFMAEYVIVELLNGGDLYQFAVYLLLGFVVATLFAMYDSVRVTGYLLLILLALDGVLQFVRCQLNMQYFLSNRKAIFFELLSLVILVLGGYLYLGHVRKMGQVEQVVAESAAGEIAEEVEERTQEEIQEDIPAEMQEEKGMAISAEMQEEENAAEMSEEDTEENLEKFLQEDFPLLIQMKEYSQSLYEHCRRISSLAAGAVREIGGDEILAGAGGLYHEVGRIAGGQDYIQAGERLAGEYGFPDKLRDVMRQHSVNAELPDSLEGAVVMLSDCVVTTCDYLEKNGKREMLSDEKLVHGVFRNRIAKGNLNRSGITVEQINLLQRYFIVHAFSKGVQNDHII